MTTNEKAMRLFAAIEAVMLGAAMVAIILFVHTSSYNDEVAMERESVERQARLMNCRCKPEIHGRELIASVCQAPTNLGPWFYECLYEKERK